MIGTAGEDGGLYYFAGDGFVEKQATIVESDFVSVSNNDVIMLWYRRLRHPNFHYLKHMFPNLLVKQNPSSFNCKICQLANIPEPPFLSGLKRVSSVLLNSYMWTIVSKKYFRCSLVHYFHR